MVSLVSRVAIGSDDTYSVALEAVKYLEEKGFEVVRIGSLLTGKPEPWPYVAYHVAKLVATREVEWGIVICFTGTGVSIVANKLPGIRAALCFDAETARGARLWNNANILAISGRLTSPYILKEIIDAWLSVRHPDPGELQNIEEITRIEQEACRFIK